MYACALSVACFPCTGWYLFTFGYRDMKRGLSAAKSPDCWLGPNLDVLDRLVILCIGFRTVLLPYFWQFFARAGLERSTTSKVFVLLYTMAFLVPYVWIWTMIMAQPGFTSLFNFGETIELWDNNTNISPNECRITRPFHGFLTTRTWALIAGHTSELVMVLESARIIQLPHVFTNLGWVSGIYHFMPALFTCFGPMCAAAAT